MNTEAINESRIEEVRREILQAFSGLEVPEVRKIIGPTSGDKASEKRLQRALSGRNWQSLDATFLAGNWSSYCYLSAEGYRYYLPALLMRCLDDFSPDNDLVHSTVFGVRPSFWELYHNGEDERFKYRNSLFSSAQYDAVCSFLGLVMDGLPFMRFLGAQALRWGWNRQENPALEKSRAFYRGLHSYEYPPHGDERVNALIAKIKAAFVNNPYPGDKEIFGPEPGFEGAEYAMEFAGLDWRHIHPELLARQHAAPSFFTRAGFRYFLPAFLFSDLFEYESNVDPVFHLTHGFVPEPPEVTTFVSSDELIAILKKTGLVSEEDLKHIEKDGAYILEDDSEPVDWHQYATERLGAFTPLERAAIVEYLPYRAGENEYPADDINLALQNYWLKGQ